MRVNLNLRLDSSLGELVKGVEDQDPWKLGGRRGSYRRDPTVTDLTITPSRLRSINSLHG